MLTSVTNTPMLDTAPIALALGSYRHDIAYTGALKSSQVQALGSYRHDIAYTGALKSAQQHALGNYRHDVSYTAALKSVLATVVDNRFQNTGVKHVVLTPVFFGINPAKANSPALQAEGGVAC